MSKSVLATPKSDSNIYFNCCILYQRQCTSMNVLKLQLVSRGGAVQVKQELYDSDGIVAEYQLHPRSDGVLLDALQYAERRHISWHNLETQNLRILNKINKNITNIMNDLGHLFYTQMNYVCLNLPCIFANQLKESISDTYPTSPWARCYKHLTKNEKK